MNEQEMGRLVLRLVGDGESYLRMLKQVQAETARTRKETLGLMDGFKDFGVHVSNRLLGGIGMGGILATGALGFATLMDTGIEAAQRREDVERSLTAVLTANGRAVTRTKERYAEYADELRETTALTALHATELLKSAEAYGITGEAARHVVEDANALGAIVGGGAEGMMKVTKAMEEGNLKLAMSYGRMIPQLRGVRDEEEWLVKYNKLLEAGMLAEADAAEDLDHKWETVKEQVADVAGAFGETVLKLGEYGLEGTKAIATSSGIADSFKDVDESVDGLKRAADVIQRVNQAYRSGKQDMADYLEARQELVREFNKAEAEFQARKARSIFDVSLDEALGKGARDKLAAAVEALDASRKRFALSVEEQLRKAARHDLGEWIKDLREEAKVADLATEAERRRQDIINKGGARGPAGREQLAELDELEAVIKVHKEKLALQKEGFDLVRSFQHELETLGMSDLDKQVYKLREAADRFRRENRDPAGPGLHPLARGVLEAFKAQVGAAQDMADRLEAARIRHEQRTPMQRLTEEVARLQRLREKGLLTEREHALQLIRQRDAILGMMAALTPQKGAFTGEHLRQRFLDYHSPALGRLAPAHRPAPVERAPAPRVVGEDFGDHGWGQSVGRARGGGADLGRAVEALTRALEGGGVRFVTVEGVA